MRALKSILALLILPGTFAGAIPTLLINHDPWRFAGSWWFAPVVAFGLSIVVKCVCDFHVYGMGTLAHVSPPVRLVSIGLYRRVRNPMYVGAVSFVLGLGLTFGSPVVLIYLVLLFTGFHLHTVLIEEPWLAREFPDEWESFSRRVPRWIPRLSSDPGE